MTSEPAHRDLEATGSAKADGDSLVTTTAILDALRDPTNTAAWEQFLGRYRPVLLNFARRRGISEPDSEDVAQNVMSEFAAAFRSGRYERGRGRLRAWLFGIARNQVSLWQRQQTNHQAREHSDGGAAAADAAGGLPGLEESWNREWQDQLLRRALAMLGGLVSARTLEAFVFFAVEDQPAEVVAARLGMTSNAVYGAKRRVLEQIELLKHQLEEET